jgi:hypothetical protein
MQAVKARKKRGKRVKSGKQATAHPKQKVSAVPLWTLFTSLCVSLLTDNGRQRQLTG